MHASTILSTLALALASTTSVLAAPAPPTSFSHASLSKRVATNNQSCQARSQGWYVSYGVNIGVTYADGSGCNDVFNALTGANLPVTNWQCVADGDGNTQLYFNLDLYEGQLLSDTLYSMYPTIVGGFNCPGY